MSKSYVFNIENCIYNVNISDNIAVITDSTGNKICDDIKIADIYIENEELILGVVKAHLACNEIYKQSDKLMEEALKKLGLA